MRAAQRWIVMLLVLLAAAFATAPAHAARYALVIGNASYTAAPPLKNAINDAEVVAGTLIDLGFDVTLLTDASAADMRAAVEDIRKKGTGAEAVLFYYSGHGFQINGTNRLVPLDAALKDRGRIDAETVSLNDLIIDLSDPRRPTFILVDACRDNPLPPSLRGTEGDGLAQVSATIANTFVLFATAPGSVTHDGAGDNGPFALALEENLPLPDQDFVGVMKKVRASVVQRTAGLQLPWAQDSMLVDFKFNVGAASMAIFDDGPLVVTGVPPLPIGTSVTPTTTVAAVPPPVVPTTTVVPVPTIAPTTTTAPTTTVAIATPTVIVPPTTTTTVTPTIAVVPTTTVEGPSEEEVATLVQTELKRIGCLPGKVDGKWGGGSRTALSRYYEFKKLEPSGLEPTVALGTQLKAETERVCPVVVRTQTNSGGTTAGGNAPPPADDNDDGPRITIGPNFGSGIGR